VYILPEAVAFVVRFEWVGLVIEIEKI